jgi:hypothetical protein
VSGLDLPQFASQIGFTDQRRESEMSKVVRFRKLKHGDPPRFKVLPENLRKSTPRGRRWRATGSFPIMVLALVGIAAVLVIGGFVG